MPDFKPGDIVELTQPLIGMASRRYMVLPTPAHYAREHRTRVTPLPRSDAAETGRQFIVKCAYCRLILPFSDLKALLDRIAAEPPCPSPSA